MPSLRRAVRGLLALTLVCTGAATVPRRIAERDAAALRRGDREAQDDLARGVAATAGLPAAAPHTGDARFDGEWALVTQQMSLIGLAQVILAHPERRPAYLPTLERCAARLIDEKTTAFGSAAWREQGLRRLDPPPGADPALRSESGHAYLGYVGLALGMLRRIDPDTRYATLHDRLSATLARRLAAAPHGLIETYPNETYPADVAMVLATLAVHDQIGKPSYRPILAKAIALLRQSAVDPETGLLYQRVDARTGQPLSPPRASGTALAAYALGFVDPALARRLTSALRDQSGGALGFAALREYPSDPSGRHPGKGDIDSGPLILGYSLAASGFALGPLRQHGHAALFTAVYRSLDLFGVPVSEDSNRRFLAGGPLGNAVLLAMLTAPALPAGGPR